MKIYEFLHSTDRSYGLGCLVHSRDNFTFQIIGYPENSINT